MANARRMMGKACDIATAPGRDAWRLCVAPMMDRTDRHCRMFHRQLAPHARLYTEMVATSAVLYGDVARHLAFSPEERPLAVQFGGSDPDDLARCAERAAAWGYDEINLNCGCPSPRVRRGAFGAVLMLEPARVAACVRAMAAASGLSISVKCRIGVDEQDDFAFLARFVERVAAAGCRIFIVHARKAWLEGLSPKQNREVPPLDHERVYRLKEAFVGLVVVLNGGIRNVPDALAHLRHVDGVMIGREAYANPWRLVELEQALFDPQFAPRREDIVRTMTAYARRLEAEGVPPRAVFRHLLGLANGLAGARRYRRILGEALAAGDRGAAALVEAFEAVRDASRAPVAAPTAASASW